MQQRSLGPFTVSALGLGCMNLSHAYGSPPPFEQAQALLLHALDRGVTHFDTAALYGFGLNEELVGRVLAPHRAKFTLASKCGMQGVDGKRVIDGRPATLERSCDDSLRRLRTEVIDLFYLHRWDRQVPIEDSVGAIGDLVRKGKVRTLGLSEVSAATLRRAHAVHPVTALQTEYSLWTRNPEIAVLDACRELGVAFVAFSPLARGWLTAELPVFDALEPRDIRRTMPRFQPGNAAANQPLRERFMALAAGLDCTPAQLALAWVLARAPHVLAIPGTRSTAHLDDNLGADGLTLDADTLAALERLFPPGAAAGPRYGAATQSEVDTEEFAA